MTMLRTPGTNASSVSIRKDGQPWTARDIKRRWGGLNELKRKREQKGLNTTDLVDVQKSA